MRRPPGVRQQLGSAGSYHWQAQFEIPPENPYISRLDLLGEEGEVYNSLQYPCDNLDGTPHDLHEAYLQFHSTIPQLETILDETDSLESLNMLATQIQELKQNGHLTVYKALLETLPSITTENALAACDFAPDFKLYPAIQTPSDYAGAVLENMEGTQVNRFQTVKFRKYSCNPLYILVFLK